MIVVLTKILCYHQLFIADELYKIYGDNFKFVQIRDSLPERVSKGQEGFDREYLLTYSTNISLVRKVIKNAKVLIYGEAPLNLVKLRNKNCLLMRMSENIFKDTQFKVTLVGKIKRFLSYSYLRFLTNNKYSFLLACSAFAPKDYNRFNLFKDKKIKWGYFPYLPNYSKKELLEEKKLSKKIELIWICRMTEYKQPLYLLKLIEYLINKKFFNFHLTIIGNNDSEKINFYKIIEKYLEEHELNEKVTLINGVKSFEIFKYYKKSHIALFTADKSEGWSVGINEAMSCGCAVVSSNGIGAAPYLLSYCKNLIFDFESPEDFCNKVYELCLCRKNAIEQGLRNFDVVHNEWNYTIAAKKLSNIIDKFLLGQPISFYENGPCSIAGEIDYNWYKE